MKILKFFVKRQPVNRDDEIERNIRRAVAMSSRGNINLQNGMYITREDLENVRKRNLAHDFTKSK